MVARTPSTCAPAAASAAWRARRTARRRRPRQGPRERPRRAARDRLVESTQAAAGAARPWSLRRLSRRAPLPPVPVRRRRRYGGRVGARAPAGTATPSAVDAMLCRRQRWAPRRGAIARAQVLAAHLEHGSRRAAAAVDDRRREHARVGDDRQLARQAARRHGAGPIAGQLQDLAGRARGRTWEQPSAMPRDEPGVDRRSPGTSTSDGPRRRRRRPGT